MSEVQNPPAFPVSSIDGFTQHGMDLRDWFAGQALPVSAAYSPDNAEDAALRAYEFAEAMLAERARSLTASAGEGK